MSRSNETDAASPIEPMAPNRSTPLSQRTGTRERLSWSTTPKSTAPAMLPTRIAPTDIPRNTSKEMYSVAWTPRREIGLARRTSRVPR